MKKVSRRKSPSATATVAHAARKTGPARTSKQRVAAAGDRDAEFETLCVDAAARHAAPAGRKGATQPSLSVTLTRMTATVCVAVQVAVASLAAFLNDIGAQTKRANFADVQVYLQRRGGKREEDDAEIWGVIVDGDAVLDDVPGAHVEGGNPVPACWWPTEHGHKAAFVFDRAAPAVEFEAIAQELTLAIAGGDHRSWQVTQAQRLPHCLKTCPDGVHDLSYDAVQSNPVPFAIDTYQPALPPRIVRLVAGTLVLTSAERARVEAHLEELGIPAPDDAGRMVYSACPAKPNHSKKCCYVNRRDGGSIYVYCCGGHGGEGAKRWTERTLYALATSNELPEGHFDPVRDLPVTWAGIALVHHRLLQAFGDAPDREELVDAALALWRLAHVALDSDYWHRRTEALEQRVVVAPTLDQYLALYRQRLGGIDRTGTFRPYFDELRAAMCLLGGDAVVPIRTRGDTLSSKTHLHEWSSSTAYTILGSETRGKEVRPVFGFDHRAASTFNKALGGHARCLAALGFPVLRIYELPVAFVKDDWSVEPRTKLIRGIRVPSLRGDSSFDVVRYFDGLYAQGRLPLASPADVRRFVMALASPLLRHIAPGLLGVYWMIGVPGGGKDLLAELLADIWRIGAGGKVKVKFDISVSEDTEHKRSFFAAGGAVYGRIKEAGKRAGMVDQIIRFAATDQVPARGMRLDEIEIPNTFTFVADSAEDLPDRREVSRRTVVINVAAVDDKKVSLGELRAEVLSHAADIIAGLKALVESKPPEWYVNRTNTGARPVIPVALASLFSVELPQVQGRDLGELYEVLLDYTTNGAGTSEGTEQKKNARDKDGKEATTFSSYRLSHFIDSMHTKAGVQHLFTEFKTPRAIHLALQREADYQEVTRRNLPYLRVEIHGRPYAFKLVRDRRNFILEKELEYCDKLGIEPLGPAAPDTVPSAALTAAAAPTTSVVTTDVQFTTPAADSAAVPHCIPIDSLLADGAKG